MKSPIGKSFNGPVMAHPNHYLKKRLLSYDNLLKLPVSSNLRRQEKLVIDQLIKQQIRSNETVLEIGCGSGFYTREILKISQRVTCFEESPVMIAQLKKLFLSRGQKLPKITIGRYPEGAPELVYDHTVSIGVLDYIEDPTAFLKTAFKNTKKSLIFTAVGAYPLGKMGQKVSALFNVHVYCHSQKQLSQILKPYKLEIQKISVLKPFPYTTLVCSVSKNSEI